MPKKETSRSFPIQENSFSFSSLSLLLAPLSPTSQENPQENLSSALPPSGANLSQDAVNKTVFFFFLKQLEEDGEGYEAP